MNTTQARVLERLAGEIGTAVSGEEISRALGISRAAVAKAVDGLRELGYGIESTPHVGHRLLARPDVLLPPEVVAGLGTARLGRHVHHVDATPSTQDIARGLAEQGAPHGTLVVAEEQTAGRGRMARPYFCPRGGVWCTLLLRGPVAAAVAPLVSLAAGVAAARAIAREAGLRPTLKWPNDVLVHGRKVVGILTEVVAEEQAIHYFLLGAGFNANIDPAAFPADLRPLATSLSAELGRSIDRRQLLQRYLLELEALYDRLLTGDRWTVVTAWRALPNILGHRVRASLWNETLEGRAVALDDDGALVVQPDGRDATRITAGDVRILPEPIG
jgi:BirA family biotin operon repressor/biotin-[acetyl-CoA-carboxylase] ligase